MGLVVSVVGLAQWWWNWCESRGCFLVMGGWFMMCWWSWWVGLVVSVAVCGYAGHDFGGLVAPNWCGWCCQRMFAVELGWDDVFGGGQHWSNLDMVLRGRLGVVKPLGGEGNLCRAVWGNIYGKGKPNKTSNKQYIKGNRW